MSRDAFLEINRHRFLRAALTAGTFAITAGATLLNALAPLNALTEQTNQILTGHSEIMKGLRQ